MSRLNTMIELFKIGFTLEDIGKHFGVSKQRVRFILYRYWPGYVDVDWKSRRTKAKDPLKAEQERWLRDRKRGTSKPWNLKYEDLDWYEHCPYTHIKLNWFAEPKEDCAPTILVVDKKLGYVPGNVQIVSWKARKIINKAKSVLRD